MRPDDRGALGIQSPFRRSFLGDRRLRIVWREHEFGIRQGRMECPDLCDETTEGLLEFRAHYAKVVGIQGLFRRPLLGDRGCLRIVGREHDSGIRQGRMECPDLMR